MDKYLKHRYLGPISIVITIGAAWYLINKNPELLKSLVEIPLIYSIGLVLLRILLLVLNGLFLKAFASKFEINLRFNEWFGLACITSMGNLLTPLSGGLIVRASYLKKQHNLSYSRFASLLTANYFFLFWAIGFVGLACSFHLMGNNKYIWIVFSIFFFVIVFCSIVFTLPIKTYQYNNRFVGFINTALEGLKVIKQDRRLVITLSLYTVFTILINSAVFWMAYTSLGIDIPINSSVLISLLSMFAILIYITPGSLGIQEAIVSSASEILGVGIAEGLIVSLLIRAALVVSAFTLGPLFSYLLMRKVNSNPPQDTLQ